MNTPHAHRGASRRPARRSGLTLIELLMATGGTGFVAAAIVAMLFAVTRGADSRTDVRSTIVRQKALVGRISAAIRSSHMVLDIDDDVIVLWMADSNGNGNPNLAEIRRIERNSDTGELSSYAAPDDLADGSNTTYPLASTDFVSTTAALKGGAGFPQSLWATQVSGWMFALNSSTVQNASLVCYRLVFDAGDFSQTAIAAAALRNR